MAWIKRNLFFVIGGILAIGLLGAAGYYNYKGWSHNTAEFDKLNEIYGTLRNLTGQKPSPGNDKVDNIAASREHLDEMIELVAAYDTLVVVMASEKFAKTSVNHSHKVMAKIKFAGASP